MQSSAAIDESTSDDELARAFVARRPAALAEAYRRHVDILYAVAHAVLGPTQDAQDCVHDTVLRLWLAPESYRLERGKLRSFLIVCVRNDAHSRRRSTQRKAEIDRRLLAERLGAQAPFAEADVGLRAQLRAALAALPAEQRAVIELAYAGDHTQTEIARRLGIPLGTVKGRVALGLRKLTTALAPSERCDR